MRDLPYLDGHEVLAQLIEDTVREANIPAPRRYRRGPKPVAAPPSNNRGKLKALWPAIQARAANGVAFKDIAVEFGCSAPAVAYIVKQGKRRDT